MKLNHQHPSNLEFHQFWKVITTIVSVHRSVRNNNDSGGNSVDNDNDNNFTSFLSLEASYAKIQQNSLTMFGMEILDRYGRLKQKQEKYSDEHSATGSLLHDDTILASWKKTIVIFTYFSNSVTP